MLWLGFRDGQRRRDGEEGSVAVAVILENQGTQDDYEALGRELGVMETPPAGNLMHLALQTETGVRLVEVWESREAFEAFVRDRLRPALARLGAGRAGGSSPPPQVYPVIFFTGGTDGSR
jgi:hypothetical protein